MLFLINLNKIYIMKKKIITVFALLTLGIVGVSQTATDSLRQEVEALKEEMRKLRLKVSIPEVEMKSYQGLGPAASKIYFADQGLSIAGYGEVTYENYTEGNKIDKGDVQRFIPYIGYKFSKKIIFNSEIEFEHAGFENVSEKEVEVSVEFMYLDFLLHKNVNIRSGLILMPVSMFNEYHEPVVFNSSLRPDVEQMIVPTTWRELGTMIYGQIIEGINYKVAVTNGLRGDLMKDWIKKGRQKGGKANFEKLSYIGRINFNKVQGLNIGASYYWGETVTEVGGEVVKEEEEEIEGTISLLTADAKYEKNGIYLNAMYGIGTSTGNDNFKKNISQLVNGWYVEGGYNVMKHLNAKAISSLTPFVRYSQYDLNAETFDNIKDPSKNRTVITAGINFKPYPLVTIKADYQWRDTNSNFSANDDANKIDQFNLAIGFIF